MNPRAGNLFDKYVLGWRRINRGYTLTLYYKYNTLRYYDADMFDDPACGNTPRTNNRKIQCKYPRHEQLEGCLKFTTNW